ADDDHVSIAHGRLQPHVEFTLGKTFQFSVSDLGCQRHGQPGGRSLIAWQSQYDPPLRLARERSK
ncbi:hypothetical protein, partial [Serratia bockelmannii]|uniref:hypothetical protein n=1 Tax=Serratia bockelmannii TaxID=2703793 RepID=UPI0023626D16